MIHNNTQQGRIQDFHGGGGRKRLCAHACTSQARFPKFLIRPGSMHGKLSFFFFFSFNALSCYLSLIFKHSHTKWDKKTHIVDQILGGRNRRPPLNPPLHRTTIIYLHEADDPRYHIPPNSRIPPPPWPLLFLP